jgi:hypothetical protein
MTHDDKEPERAKAYARPTLEKRTKLINIAEQQRPAPVSGVIVT